MYKNKNFHAKTMLLVVLLISFLFYLYEIIQTMIIGATITREDLIFLIGNFLAPLTYAIPFILALFIIIISINLLKNKFDDKKGRIALRISTILYIAFLLFAWCLSFDELLSCVTHKNFTALLVTDIIFGIITLICVVVSTIFLFKEGFDTIYSFVLFDKDIIITKTIDKTQNSEEKNSIENNFDKKV